MTNKNIAQEKSELNSSEGKNQSYEKIQGRRDNMSSPGDKNYED